VIKHNFDQTPILLESFDQVIRSSEIRSSDPLSLKERPRPHKYSFSFRLSFAYTLHTIAFISGNTNALRHHRGLCSLLDTLSDFQYSPIFWLHSNSVERIHETPQNWSHANGIS
jgi:hypothetical protein